MRARAISGYRARQGTTQKAWSPLALSPFAWFRSDLGVTLNGSTVSAWADQSGNGKHATQATAGNQPTFSLAGGRGGRPKITSAASRYVQCATAADWTFLHSGTGASIVLVSESRVTPVNYLLGTQTSSGVNRGINLYWGGTFVRNYTGNGTNELFSPLQAATASTLIKTVWTYASADTPDAGISVNFAAATTANEGFTPSGTAPVGGLAIGTGVTGAFGTDTDFYELIVFNRSLTAAEKSTLQAYLTKVYG
jgi:hypothetical protein